MKEQDPITRFLTRADNFAIALAAKRALATLDKPGHDKLSESIAQVLADPDNLRIARLISKRVDPIKKELLRSFGLGLHLQLGEMLGASDVKNQWRLEKDSKDWTNAYASSSFWPIRDDGEGGVPCLFVIIQRTDNFMNLGISRTEEKKKRPDYWQLQPVKDLAVWLRKHGYGPHRWWLGYRKLHDLREHNLYLALAGNMDEVVKEAFDATWKLFSETREMMEEANQALIKYVPLMVK